MKGYHLCLTFVALITFTSCSGKLTNTEATKLISELPNEMVAGQIKIWMSGASYTKGEIYNSLNSENAALIDKGILTIKNVNAGYYEYGLTSYSAYAELTDTAKNLVIMDDNRQSQEKIYLVKCGELIFSDVAGIFQEKNSNTAEIEYNSIFEPTIFAGLGITKPEYLEGNTYKKKIQAKKYDTGWKLELPEDMIKLQELSDKLDYKISKSKENEAQQKQLKNAIEVADSLHENSKNGEGDPGFKFEFEPDATGIVKVGDFLSLKESPNINSKAILKLSNGDVVKMLEETDNSETIDGEYNIWYKVSYKDKVGYVFGKYLDIQY